MIGRTLDGRYRLDRVLGEGGMGAVYEATHLGTGRRVAIKVIQQIALGDTDVFTRFQREARASSAVDTRHIVEVLDSGRDPETGLPYMAMEKLEGEDLGAHLERTGPMSTRLALRVVAQACFGLAKAHHADVVHRDIKPANLFLTREEDDEVIVKLLDFGIAKVRPKSPLEGEGLALTQTGRLLGTPLYMSPEQAQGMKDIDHRTDLWSLGAVLFEALTGKPPFDAENLGKLILAICAKPVRMPSTLVPGIPPEVDAIVARAMKIERDERYPSADAFLEDLLALLPDGYGIGIVELGGAPSVRRLRKTAGSGRRIPSAAPVTDGSHTPIRVTPPAAVDGLEETHAADDVGVASTLYASVGALPSPARRRRRIGVAVGAGVLLAIGGGLWLQRGAGERPALGTVSSGAAVASSTDHALASVSPVATPERTSQASASPPPATTKPEVSATASTASSARPRPSTAPTTKPASSATPAPSAKPIEYEEKFQ